MMISIFNGSQLFETRECALVRLPDGRDGAIWRGLAYPLAPPDGRIEIDGEAFPPGGGVGIKATLSTFALLEGIDEAYVLLSGPVTANESVSGTLKASGYDVIRTGRYLGDPVDGLEADWFIRISKPRGGLAGLSTLLTEHLGGPSEVALGEEAVGGHRARVIAVELAWAKAREAALRIEMARLRLNLAKEDSTQIEVEALRTALEDERRLREEADLEASAAALRVTDTPAVRPIFAQGKLKGEIEVVIETFLPSLRLIRDSVVVIAAEFSSRRALYRGLQELRLTNGRLPPAWKKLKGVEDWWERHISNGQDDAGRVYARLVGEESVWDVLISHKGEQSRDIIWLSRQ